MLSSREIAESLKKPHRGVLTAIRNLSCPEDFKAEHFVATTFADGQGRYYPEYLVSQDGYTLLCLHFTNAKCTDWKVSLIRDYKLPVMGL